MKRSKYQRHQNELTDYIEERFSLAQLLTVVLSVLAVLCFLFSAGGVIVLMDGVVSGLDSFKEVFLNIKGAMLVSGVVTGCVLLVIRAVVGILLESAFYHYSIWTVLSEGNKSDKNR